jgi:hypothetical protein
MHFLLAYFLRQGLAMYANSLYSSLHLPTTGIAGTCHQAWNLYKTFSNLLSDKEFFQESIFLTRFPALILFLCLIKWLVLLMFVICEDGILR